MNELSILLKLAIIILMILIFLFAGKTIHYFSASGDLLTLDLEKESKTLIVSSQEFSEKLNNRRPFKVEFSPTRKFLLISYDPQKVYRHSVFALYSVLDLETRWVAGIKDVLIINEVNDYYSN